MTSNTDTIYPFQVLLVAAETGLQVDSKARAEQIRAVAVERLGAVLGMVPNHVLDHLDDALRVHRGL